jgi:MFS superfamily sulfate permease-like transporter
MAYVPHAALSGILVYVALKIFRLGEMIRIYREGGWEILLVAASGGLVVALPIEIGMLLAIVLSFVYSHYAVAPNGNNLHLSLHARKVAAGRRRPGTSSTVRLWLVAMTG